MPNDSTVFKSPLPCLFRKNIHKTTAFKLPLKSLLRSPAVEVLGVGIGVCARVVYHATAMVALAVDRTQLERLGAGVDDAVFRTPKSHPRYIRHGS